MQAGGRVHGWEHSVAGAVAGSTAVLLLHPFDVIKTRLQVQDGHQGQLLGSYQGSVHAVRTILQREGWRSFYNGLLPAWMGSGLAWSAYFTAYEWFKGMYAQRVPEGQRLKPIYNTISAAQAGAMVCLLTNPIWLVKTRLQLQKSTLDVRRESKAGPLPTASQVSVGSATAGNAVGSLSASTGNSATSISNHSSSALPSTSGRTNGTVTSLEAVQLKVNQGSSSASAAGTASTAAGRQYKGLLDALIRVGREEGFRGYYKGLGPSLVLQTTHGAVQFTVYEELKHLSARWGAASSSTPDRRPTSLETSGAAVLSKLTAAIVTYPTQVVRSRIQQRFDLGRTLQYRTTWEVVKLTWQREGVIGFYKGLGPALLRTLPQSAITLLVYENMLHLLQQTRKQRT